MKLLKISLTNIEDICRYHVPESEDSYRDYFDLTKKPKERIVAIIEGTSA